MSCTIELSCVYSALHVRAAMRVLCRARSATLRVLRRASSTTLYVTAVYVRVDAATSVTLTCLSHVSKGTHTYAPANDALSTVVHFMHNILQHACRALHAQHLTARLSPSHMWTVTVRKP
ncbi:hypothetical protein AMTR_s00035p00162470 [Amborella trichopoda]|uniref:Uncharacterized protein n=1 Tax=Amborella trichopoda TaxID=13333 RepID=W1PXB7_AMBTC|nr:hypothetical protein AMTR_s00035p00162470 [Amborella trichopoda]